MKSLLSALSIVLLLISCKKTVTKEEGVNPVTVSSEANSPLNCHTLSFTTDYPVKPGEVPPFSFTKTQYPDARIRTIRMLSRNNPIYPGFKKEAVELTGTFTYEANQDPEDAEYNPHVAYLKGISEAWEYYRTPTGAPGKRSVSRKGVNYRFTLNRSGYCTRVIDLDRPSPSNYMLEVIYRDITMEIELIIVHGVENFNEVEAFYVPTRDQYGNITSFELNSQLKHYYRIVYDYSAPRGARNFSFIPSQNLISQEYSLLEVMQWLPQSTHQRKSAGGTFKVNEQWVSQDQVYKNYQFDAKGNLTSLTYGDNILQKTAWHCQN